MQEMNVSTGKRPATGFGQILEDIERSLEGHFTLAGAIDRIVTFNGRFPLSRGLLCLTRGQRNLYDRLGQIQGVRTDGSTPISTGILLGIMPYGRIILVPAARYPALETGLLAHFPIPETELPAPIMEPEIPDAADENAMRQIEAFYSGMAVERADGILEEIEYMVDHIDPVLIYAGDATYTLFGKYNNLLARGGSGAYLIQDLNGKSPSTWSPTERSFIFNMYWLKQSGLRAEEFNGRQLDLESLLSLWEEKSALYRAALGHPPQAEPEREARAGAGAMKALRESVRTRHRIYRDVHGLNFHKQEGPLPTEKVVEASERLLGPLASDLAAVFGLSAPKPGSLRTLFEEYVIKAFASPPVGQPDAENNPIEEMIVFLVRYAARVSASDIAMSRGIRDPGRIALLGQDAFCREASSWPATDYFCCALPSGLFQAKTEAYGPVLFTILNSISKRMEYNSWHYTPGHFSAAAVPADRHFYLPPAMPDFAQWSNQHHSGHVMSNVMYSIRSPGSLTCNGRILPGVFDLRLMRQTGEPYGLGDLAEAVAFTGFMGQFYQAVLDRTLADQTDFRVRAFTKGWYSTRFYAGAPAGKAHVHG